MIKKQNQKNIELLTPFYVNTNINLDKNIKSCNLVVPGIKCVECVTIS
jgi:hypothetical protein